jgi:hypothetical protein
MTAATKPKPLAVRIILHTVVNGLKSERVLIVPEKKG